MITDFPGLVEQELLTLPEHLSSPPVFNVTRSLVLSVCFVDHCLSFCTFFFQSLCCLFFFDVRIQIAPLVSSNSSPIKSDGLSQFYGPKPKVRVIVKAVVCNVTFNDISVISLAVSFVGGGNRSTWKKPPTCHKSLIAQVVINPTTIRSGPRWPPIIYDSNNTITVGIEILSVNIENCAESKIVYQNWNLKYETKQMFYVLFCQPLRLSTSSTNMINIVFDNHS